MLTTVLSFVLVLGIIIFVHELGHLLVAKAFGIRAFVFSLGFGKRLAGFQWGDTDCRVSLIPLGGYVKLEGEPGDHLSEDTSTLGDGRDFLSRPRWQRFLVYLAGPAMNAVLAISIFTGLYMVGFEEPSSLSLPPVVGAVQPGSPAEAAGLQPGDLVLTVDEQPQPTWGELAYSLLIRPDADLRLRIRRDGAERQVSLRSTATPDKTGDIGIRPFSFVQVVTPGGAAEQAGLRPGDAIAAVGSTPIRSPEDVRPAVVAAGTSAVVVRVYRDGQFLDLGMTPRDSGSGPMIGVQIGEKLVVKQYPLVHAVRAAVNRSWDETRRIGEVLVRLLRAQLSPKTMAGPLGIAQMSGEAARHGLQYWWGFVAIISLNVGLLNLFPLAPLDGGHMLILAAEGTARRDLHPTVKNWVMNAGAALIFLLIGLVIYSDISKMSFVQKLLQ